jgi:hypothetical protein
MAAIFMTPAYKKIVPLIVSAPTSSHFPGSICLFTIPFFSMTSHFLFDPGDLFPTHLKKSRSCLHLTSLAVIKDRSRGGDCMFSQDAQQQINHSFGWNVHCQTCLI